MDASDWDWTRIVVDHLDVHASNYAESVRFYETVLAPLGIPRIGESDEGACFTNVNVVDRKPPTTNASLLPREVAGTGGRISRRRTRGRLPLQRCARLPRLPGLRMSLAARGLRARRFGALPSGPSPRSSVDRAAVSYTEASTADSAPRLGEA
jgi:hypothetical protein